MKYSKYKKVLFCTDLSENSDLAFDYAHGISKRDDGILFILHVIPEHPYEMMIGRFYGKEDFERIQKATEDYLDREFRNRYLGKMDTSDKFEIVTLSGREDEEIVKFACEEGLDLIVMGTHGRTGVKHAFVGSVAERVLRHSPIPVFVIPAKEKSAA
jgi:nucleotide-binding universal stress UspA family protein